MPASIKACTSICRTRCSRRMLVLPERATSACDAGAAAPLSTMSRVDTAAPDAPLTVPL